LDGLQELGEGFNHLSYALENNCTRETEELWFYFDGKLAETLKRMSTSHDDVSTDRCQSFIIKLNGQKLDMIRKQFKFSEKHKMLIKKEAQKQEARTSRARKRLLQKQNTELRKSIE
jgi:hypothetical protein